jgi:flavin reductase (DIM6/NTAB) family NADH-FMN oxidoreductase RutF
MNDLCFSEKEFKSWDRFYRANFFNSVGGFKSLNLIGTKGVSSSENLALFFSVSHVGANPPLVGLLFRPHTVARHTLENIRETGSFTVNAVKESMLSKAHQTSASYPEEVSEFEAVGLTTWYSKFSAPYVLESPVKIGVQLEEEHFIKTNETIFMVGSIKEVFLKEQLLQKDGLIDLAQADALCVNALNTYYKPKLVSRLSYARPDEEPKKL